MQMLVKIFNAIEEYLLGVTLLGLAIYSFIQVLTRYILNYSFTSYEEVARYGCIFITFLGASLGIKYSSHFAMTAVVERLPYRFRHLVSALVWLISALFFFMVTYFGIIQCLKQIRFGVVAPALQIPMFIFVLPIPVFAAVMGCRSLGLLYKALVCTFKGYNRAEVVYGKRGEAS